MKINSNKITFSIPLENSKANTKITMKCAEKIAEDLIGTTIDYYNDLEYYIISADIEGKYIWIEAESGIKQSNQND